MKSIYDLQIFDISSDDIDEKFIITIYGKTTDNQNIVCHITDFKPFFYVKIPDNWNHQTVETQFIPELKNRSYGYYDNKSNYLGNISKPNYKKDFY